MNKQAETKDVLQNMYFITNPPIKTENVTCKGADHLFGGSGQCLHCGAHRDPVYR